MALTFIVLFST